MEVCCSFKALVCGTTLRLRGTSHQNVSEYYLKEITVLRNARGPQHHPSREHPSCQKPHPTPAPRKIFFVCVRGIGGEGVGAYLFSKLDKWRREKRTKFKAENIVSNMWHDDWLMN